MNIFQKHGQSNNVWISYIGEKEVRHIALDSHGKVIDEFTQDSQAYR